MAEAITEEAFKEEALDFLSANATLKVEEKTGWGEGSDKVGLFAERTKEQELAAVEESKQWRQRFFDAGFGWITGPSRYGGRGMPAASDPLGAAPAGVG